MGIRDSLASRAGEVSPTMILKGKGGKKGIQMGQQGKGKGGDPKGGSDSNESLWSTPLSQENRRRLMQNEVLLELNTAQSNNYAILSTDEKKAFKACSCMKEAEEFRGAISNASRR